MYAWSCQDNSSVRMSGAPACRLVPLPSLAASIQLLTPPHPSLLTPPCPSPLALERVRLSVVGVQGQVQDLHSEGTHARSHTLFLEKALEKARSLDAVL